MRFCNICGGVVKDWAANCSYCGTFLGKIADAPDSNVPEHKPIEQPEAQELATPKPEVSAKSASPVETYDPEYELLEQLETGNYSPELLDELEAQELEASRSDGSSIKTDEPEYETSEQPELKNLIPYYDAWQVFKGMPKEMRKSLKILAIATIIVFGTIILLLRILSR